MNLASIQKMLNQSETTTETLQSVDKLQLTAGTVLQHKEHSDRIVTIQTIQDHYIVGLIYHVVDTNGGEWILPAYHLHLWETLK